MKKILFGILGIVLTCLMGLDLLAADWVPGELLIKHKPGVSSVQLDNYNKTMGITSVRILEAGQNDWSVIKFNPLDDVREKVKEYMKSGLVLYAEPNYIRYADPMIVSENEEDLDEMVTAAATNIPNDPAFKYNDDCYSFKVTDAVSAWSNITDASSIIVAVVDSGIRYTHEDLKDNMWTDKNGRYGISIRNGDRNYDCCPIDVENEYHGTHVAGTIGAVGNNGKGTAGVAWKVKLMGCKLFWNGSICGTTDFVECMEYARLNGAKIINLSLGGYNNSSKLEREEIAEAQKAGILVICAAGNGIKNSEGEKVGVDTDDSRYHHYPSCYCTEFDNVISVGASDSSDKTASFSNYGKTTVNLFAPGVSIYSTVSHSDAMYAWADGTSMAAPFVSGAAALCWAKYPNENYLQIKNRILNSVDKISSLSTKCSTGGRINVKKMFEDPPLVPDSISISGSDSVEVDSTATYTCTAKYSDRTSEKVQPTWSVSPTTYASIDSEGVLTGKAAGTATVKATYEGLSSTKSVTVKKTPVSISISGSDSCSVGISTNYTCTAKYSDGTSGKVQPIWSVSPTTYASIDSGGVLTGTAVGSVKVKATYENKWAQKDVEITKGILTSIVIAGASTVYKNNSETYVCIANYSDGSKKLVTSTSVAWSANLFVPGYASVRMASDGELTVTSVNTAGTPVTVKASYKEAGVTKNASKTVTIEKGSKPSPYLNSLSISGSDRVNVGSVTTYTCTANYSDGTRKITPTWGVSSTACASITSGGVLSGNAEGTVTIIAYNGEKAVTKTVSVEGGTDPDPDPDPDPYLVSIYIDGPDSVYVNDTATYTCTATYSKGTPETVTPTWSISSGTNYASISSKGILKGKEVGIAEVKASYEGKTATMVVSIKDPDPDPDPDPSDLSASRSFSTTTPNKGETLDVSVTITSKSTITSLYVSEELPKGWSFDSMLSSGLGVTPSAGQTGEIEFLWLTKPDLPYTLKYRVKAPDTKGIYTWLGNVKWRITDNEKTGTIRGNSTVEIVDHHYHTADYNHDYKISLSPELTRVVQFYNTGGYHNASGTEDGYAPGTGTITAYHDSDYSPKDGKISLSPELTRLVQFYNTGGYHIASGTEDGFAPGAASGVTSVHLAAAGGTLKGVRTFNPSTYRGSPTIDVSIEISVSGQEDISSLYVSEVLPEGWTFDSMVTSVPVNMYSGASRTLELVWIDMPTLPYTLTYRVKVPSNAKGDYTWSGNVKWRATEGEKEVVTGGTTVIREKDPNPDPVLVSISISGPDSVSKDSTAQYTCTATYSDGSPKEVNPEWSFSPINSVSITPTGVTFKEVGTVTVTASYTEGEVTRKATKKVEVKEVPVPPTITTQPKSQTVNEGSSLTFTVVATGTAPLSYQWYKGSSKISGATSASYTINPVKTTDEGSYKVVVTNIVGSVTSSAATLKVNPTNRVLVSIVISGSDSVNVGSTATYTCTAEYSDGSTNKVNPEWSVRPTTYAKITSGGVLTGKAEGTVTVTASYTEGEVSQTKTKSVAITIPNGEATISMVSTNLVTYGDSCGTLVGTKAGSEIIGLLLYDGVEVARQVFAVSAKGVATGKLKGDIITTDKVPAGTNVILQLAAFDQGYLDHPSTGNYYYGISKPFEYHTGDSNSISPDANLGYDSFTIEWVVPPTITTQPKSQTVNEGSSVTFSVKAEGTAPLSYQWYKGSSKINNATNASYKISSAKTTDEGSYKVVVTNIVGSVTSSAATLKVNPTNRVLVSIVISGSDSVNVGSTATYTCTAEYSDGSTNKVNPEWSFSPINSVSITPTGVTFKEVGTVTVTASYTEGEVTRKATKKVEVKEVPVPPTITTQPKSQTVNEGSSLTFTVVATGTAPLSYQWYKGSSKISGATSASYTINPVKTTDEGSYKVVVTNIVGSVTSNAATLKVIPDPDPNGTAVRSVSGNSKNSATVKLTLKPDENVSVIFVEERVPAGVTISVNNGGTYTASKNMIRWSSLDGSMREVSYVLTVADDFVGEVSLSGEVTFDERTVSVTGDRMIQFPIFLTHPADMNNDWEISTTEVSSYALAWTKGQSWSREPADIPVLYVSRAAMIWVNGGYYDYDPGKSEPSCWVSTNVKPTSVELAADSVNVRTINVLEGKANVSVEVIPADGVSIYFVEEQLPAGMNLNVTNISDGGKYVEDRGLIRWSFLDGTLRTLTYTMEPEVGFKGVIPVNGEVTFDEETQATSGDVEADFRDNPAITYVLKGETLILSFTGTLYESDDAINWRIVEGAKAPFKVDITRGKKFYRCVQ